jgi:hypothetical protein
VWVAALLAAGGCAGSDLLSELGLPTDRETAAVEEYAEHGGYLAATLAGTTFRLRFLFPASDECQRVLRYPGRIEYIRVGRIGEVARGASHCEARGIASLEAWRDRSTRVVAETLPAGNDARFTPIFIDPAMILARGRFPQAVRIGWTSNRDIVAMLPRNPACDEVARLGQAVMKFHATGSPAFTLSTPDAHCAVIGLADPL